MEQALTRLDQIKPRLKTQGIVCVSMHDLKILIDPDNELGDWSTEHINIVKSWANTNNICVYSVNWKAYFIDAISFWFEGDALVLGKDRYKAITLAPEWLYGLLQIKPITLAALNQYIHASEYKFSETELEFITSNIQAVLSAVKNISQPVLKRIDQYITTA